MKRTYLYFLTVLFTCLLALFSCRKDIEFLLEGKESPSASVLENAKIYYMQNINSARADRLDAKWKESWIVKQNGKEVLVVPAPQRKLYEKGYDIQRYFAFDYKNEKITKANIVEFLSKDYDLKANIDNLILLNKGNNQNFEGSILYYDINYRYIESFSFKNGKLEENKEASIITSSILDFKENYIKKGRLLSSTRKKAVVCPYVEPYWTNNVPGAAYGEGCTVTIYREVTYDLNNCATDITFTYTGHECPSVCTTCGSGSGGSGSGSGSGDSGGNPPYGGGGTVDPLDPFPSYNIYVGDEGIDLTARLNCFNTVVNNSQTVYTISLSADLPNSNNPNALLSSENRVGHAYITLQKANNGNVVRQSFGFYPKSGFAAILKAGSVASQINDEGSSNRYAEATLVKDVTAAQFQTIITTANNSANFQYDLDTYNCTDYAVQVFNSGMAFADKINVQDWIVERNTPTGAPLPINYGTTPPGLYKAIKAKKDAGVAGATTNPIKVQSNTGCN